MKQIDAVIFDCDGVMFESKKANLAYYNRILGEFSYPHVSSDQTDLAHLCHTASSPVVLENLMREEDLSLALSFASTLDYREFIPHMNAEENLMEILDLISGRFPLAIATNRGKSVESILDHFNLRRYFSVVVTSHDVKQPKPAPDMLLLAAQKLKIKPENCLFIGDSELDKSAANDANTQFAGYGGGVSGQFSFTNHLDLLTFLPSE